MNNKTLLGGLVILGLVLTVGLYGCKREEAPPANQPPANVNAPVAPTNEAAPMNEVKPTNEAAAPTNAAAPANEAPAPEAPANTPAEPPANH